MRVPHTSLKSASEEVSGPRDGDGPTLPARLSLRKEQATEHCAAPHPPGLHRQPDAGSPGRQRLKAAPGSRTQGAGAARNHLTQNEGTFLGHELGARFRLHRGSLSPLSAIQQSTCPDSTPCEGAREALLGPLLSPTGGDPFSKVPSGPPLVRTAVSSLCPFPFP